MKKNLTMKTLTKPVKNAIIVVETEDYILLSWYFDFDLFNKLKAQEPHILNAFLKTRVIKI